MPLVVLDAMRSVFERTKITHGLDRAAIVFKVSMKGKITRVFHPLFKISLYTAVLLAQDLQEYEWNQ
jgi:hypothetical protein